MKFKLRLNSPIQKGIILNQFRKKLLKIQTADHSFLFRAINLLPLFIIILYRHSSLQQFTDPGRLNKC
jgi:hypothetical protein